jgi:hypothetical protein
LNENEIEAAIAGCETDMAAGRPIDVRGNRFWKAVAAVKADSSLTDRYADRIGAIDNAAFQNWALYTVPSGTGTTLMVLATVAGLAIIAAGYYVDEPWNGLALVLGTVVLLFSTHGLTHMTVGRLQGMEFTNWFIGTISRPQPGVKIAYASYLRTPARSRAWMHASGAIVTKLLPFLMLGAAWGMEAPAWSWWVLIIIGVGQILTDALWSTKASDWKKYRREMKYVSA